MECREVEQLAEAFVSEQLDVETTGAVAAHIEHCAACRRGIEGLRRLRAATQSAFERAPDLAPRPAFAASLTARLRAEAARHSESRSSRRVWLAIAAGVLLAVGAGWGWREWSSGFAALLHAAVGDHRFCALTFRLAEPPITLEEAARRFAAFNGELEVVEPSTPTLSGGPLRIVERHSCVFDNRRFAHIVLRYKGETVSLLVPDDPRPGEAPARLKETPSGVSLTDTFHVAWFRATGRVVFVVSSLGTDDVQEVAQAMSGPVSGALAGS